MLTIAKVFDHIGKAMTSMGAVTFVLLMYVTGMIACSHTLFYKVFPDSMQLWEKNLAAWTISLAWELTVLVTISNPKHIDKRIPWAIAIASGVIMLFFVEAFDLSAESLQIAQRWFLGIITAVVGYIYAHLFYAKWAEYANVTAMPSMVADLQAKLAQSEANVDERDRKVAQLQADLADARPKLKQLDAMLAKDECDRTCPWCKQVLDNPKSLNSHKGHCVKNPRKANE
jgi:hypothetical protein